MEGHDRAELMDYSLCYPSPMKPFYKPQQGRRTKEHMHAQAHTQVNKSSSAQALCFQITFRKAII